MKHSIRACTVMSAVLFLTAALAGFPAASQDRVWSFPVYLNDAEIGHHRFTLRDENEARE